MSLPASLVRVVLIATILELELPEPETFTRPQLSNNLYNLIHLFLVYELRLPRAVSFPQAILHRHGRSGYRQTHYGVLAHWQACDCTTACGRSSC